MASHPTSNFSRLATSRVVCCAFRFGGVQLPHVTGGLGLLTLNRWCQWHPPRLLQTKFHARWNYTWRDPAHELPHWTGADGAEHTVPRSNLRVHHHPDPTKSRSSYLGLLKLGVEEDPSNARRAYYYGRELFYEGQHDAAISELERYLQLPGATYKDERASARCIIAKCHMAQGRLQEAQRAAHHGVLEVGDLRDCWLALAVSSDILRDWHTAYWAATKALAITTRRHTSFDDGLSWGWRPHDVAALAAYRAGFYGKALEHGEAALSLKPGDPRLLENLRFYQEAVQSGAACQQPSASSNSSGEGDVCSAIAGKENGKHLHFPFCLN